jgi:peptidylprolyl isomerase
LAVSLSGCGGDSAKSSSSTSSSQAASAHVLDGITVSGGDAKTAPTIDIAKKPLKAAAFETKVVHAGTGDTITDKDLVTVEYFLVNGTTGEKIDSNWGTPTGFDLSNTQLLAGLRKSLIGAKVGAQMLSAMPPADQFGPQGGSAQLNIKADDTLVMLYDVVKKIAILPHADGAEHKLDSALPKVAWNDGKAAVITMPKSDPPTKLVVKQILTGTGDKVQSGQTAVVSYTGALWRNGKNFDSSFDHGGKFEFAVGGKQVISGWDKGVLDQPVGSRLLLIVPPDEGYGKAGKGDIKGTDTLVFVVDILAAY